MKSTLRFSILYAVLLIAPVAIQEYASAVDPDPNRGLYAIWAKPDVLRLPFLRGGQVVLQWRDVQVDENRYDFSKLDQLLAQAAESKRPVTVQLNGNRHPDFLFDLVPHVKERLSVQVGDSKGTLQYWHPNYVKAYLDLLVAYSEHLRQSPHRQWLLGVRMNFNALGTEHVQVPKPLQDASAWTTPPGVAPGPPWRRDVGNQYKRRVLDAFVEDFTPDIRVFVRNNLAGEMEPGSKLLDMLETGRLGLFHTSTEIEPRSAGVERQYLAFLRFCRSGTTLAYAESWADSWGRHGGQTDERTCSPAQWNYWRLLCDLHCGVSFIAVYGADLAHADNPEFRAAFDFAARYAGYHASPTVAPGAWVAFREGNYLKGDYAFLMRCLDSENGSPVDNVGPDDQRFGTWARCFPQGKLIRFAADEQFAESLDKPTTVRVTYFDDRPGTFTITVGGRSSSTTMKGSARWQTAEMEVDGRLLAGGLTPHLTIEPATGLTLHMVEIVRGQ